MTIDQQTCKTCLFLKRRMRIRTYPNNLPDEEETVCHRYPRAFQSIDRGGRFDFPWTGEEDWGGEWKHNPKSEIKL